MALGTPLQRESKLWPVRTFAAEQHDAQGQTYGSEKASYVAHLDAVVEVLIRYGLREEADFELLAAAYCHDLLENTGLAVNLLATAFGVRVAELVWAVTDEPGKNRAARHAATYPKTRAAGKSAVTLKLADRIANVEQCVLERGRMHTVVEWRQEGATLTPFAGESSRLKPGLLEMYRKEHPGFRAALYAAEDGEPNEWMWRHLDELCLWTPR